MSDETKTQWTPGPWVKRGSGQKIWVGKGLISGEPGIDEDGKPLIEEFVPPHVVRIYKDEEGRSCTQFVATCNGATCPNEANARLISKAPELADSLAEMREACAACFRVIASVNGLSEKLSEELTRAGVKEGFGVRAQRLLAEINSGESPTQP